LERRSSHPTPPKPRQAPSGSIFFAYRSDACPRSALASFFKTKSVPELSAVTQKWPELTRPLGLRVSERVLVAPAMSSPTLLLKVEVSNDAISLQYIHSKADLSVLITFSEERLFSVPF
jgi:hypothetical protein